MCKILAKNVYSVSFYDSRQKFSLLRNETVGVFLLGSVRDLATKKHENAGLTKEYGKINSNGMHSLLRFKIYFSASGFTIPQWKFLESSDDGRFH